MNEALLTEDSEKGGAALSSLKRNVKMHAGRTTVKIVMHGQCLSQAVAYALPTFRKALQHDPSEPGRVGPECAGRHAPALNDNVAPLFVALLF